MKKQKFEKVVVEIIYMSDDVITTSGENSNEEGIGVAWPWEDTYTDVFD